MSAQLAVLRTGLVLMHDGEQFTVVEIAGTRVLLRSRLGALRQVDLGWLLGHPSTSVPEASTEPGTGLGAEFGALSDEENAALRERFEHLQEVETGYRLGSVELALEGEPRAPYAPGVPKMARYEAKAAELGVSVMTVRRWLMKVKGPEGIAALLPADRARDPLGTSDPRWIDMCRKVLDEYVEDSTPPRYLVIATVEERLAAEYGQGAVKLPKKSAAYELLRQLGKGRNAFEGSAKGRRSIANRPPGVYGRLRATRPGEYVLIDTTRLDVFAMEPVTCRWVQVELTVAMDLYTRCITGLRLTPVSTKAVDVAAVLYETVRPRTGGEDRAVLPHHGVPSTVVVDARRMVDAHGDYVLPSVAAETLVFDHGKIYLSNHVQAVCDRLGMSLQPARPYTPTDKAPIERWFKTLREGVLAPLPGYKGADVHSRGKDVEEKAYFFVPELEAIIREWIDLCYHRRAHKGLCVPEAPGIRLSPLEMYEHGIQRAGHLRILGRPDLAYDFLEVKWTTIQHYGVEVNTLRYNGPALKGRGTTTSPYGGVHAGAWPIALDPGDVTRAYFQDPKSKQWYELRWEHADALDGPMSREAFQYARRLAIRTQRFPDTKRTLIQLLERWGAGLTGNRAERRMALRLSDERLRIMGPEPDAEDPEAMTVDRLPLVRQLTALADGRPSADEAADRLAPAGTLLETAGDDDEDDELDAAFPKDTEALSDEEYYADTWEVS
ncbi:Integrase core domain-containing protein [Streptomyces sp. Ncost-T6T-1]|uniref:DDE-type integrase/transposase/recombinase n=1 Tax=Streptomyces sp. Ncost-T6T-1 TaxID=1100828 RepID=UPI000805C290|nr:DDE-type integrase/transposase/recombinase [Streptomyces sp. Ncost-T6T-1]SBU96840.1 Integrase core domain-containing protein [Streptomyces sp. Ncost-T6T-1]